MKPLLIAVVVAGILGTVGLAWAWWQRRQEEKAADARILRIAGSEDPPTRLDRLRAIAASKREDRERWP